MIDLEKFFKDREKIFQDRGYQEEGSFILRPKRIPPTKRDTSPQTSGKKFEKRVWRLFYNFGAQILNGPKSVKDKKQELTFDLTTEYGQRKCKVPSQQVDNCFIVRGQYVFFIECKYRTTSQSANALVRKDLANWEATMGALETRFETLYGKKNLLGKGGKWIFIHVTATSGFNWSTGMIADEETGELVERDPIKDMKDSGFIVLTENELSYFEKIFMNSGSEYFAFNQFLGLFKTEQNFMTGKQRAWTAFRTRTDAGEDGEMGTDDDKFAYTTSMEVKDLIKISSISHSKGMNIYEASQKVLGHYQRILKKKRLSRTSEKGVPWFIETHNKPFINNLLINYRGEVPLSDIFKPGEGSGQGQKSTEGRGGLLKFPELNPGMFQIIDGQHRLFGYAPLIQEDADSEFGKHEIIVTIFDRLKPEEEAEIFLNVNDYQEGIDKGLVLDIKQLFGADGPPSRVLDNLVSTTIDKLKDDKRSPFFKPKAFKETENIKDINKEGEIAIQGALTKTGIYTELKKTALVRRSGDDSYENGLAFKKGKDKYESYQKTIDNLFGIYSEYFSLIKNARKDWWEKINDGGRIVSNNERIAQNIPIGGMILLLERFISDKTEGSKPTIKKGGPVLSKINKNLSKLEDVIKNMPEDSENELFGDKTYGSSGSNQFFYYMLKKFFPALLTDNIREQINKTERKYLDQRGGLYTFQRAEMRESAEKHKNATDQGVRSLANEEILFALLDAFFRKIIGLEYWENYIKQHHQSAYDHSTNQERDRIKDLESKGVENPEKEVYPIKIYFNRMVDFRDMMSELHKHPSKHKKYLDPTFADSVEFLEEYDGKLNILIEKLFFIMKKGEKQPNRKEHLVKWVTISNQVRDEPSHKRNHPYLVDQERKAFDEIDPKIQNLLKKLNKFVGV